MNYHISITEDGILSYPMHKHMFCEIMLYLEGTGFLRTENGNIPFDSGTAIIVPQGIMHGSMSEHGFRNISIGGSFGQLLFFDSPVSIKTDKDTGILGGLIYNNRLTDNSYLNSLVNCYVTSLLKNFQSSSQIHSAVNGILKTISENALNNDFKVTSALQHSGYAEDYIRAKFRTATGKTPVEFLNSLRIQHACRLVEIYGITLSVTELSEKCGFSNAAYFSRIFKIYKGVSPQQYMRNQHRLSSFAKRP